MPTKFLHTADLQLGLTRHFLGSDAQPRFAAARNDAIRSIGELAADEGCSFVVACGDVFESNHVSRQVVVRALDALGDVPVPVYLLPGNHDPLDAGSVYRSATFRASVPSNVHVLESGAPVEASPGAWLVAAPWLSKHPLEDLAARSLSDLRELLADADGRAVGPARILVAHGIVDLLSPDATDPAAILLAGLENALGAGIVHYVALGDRHSVTDVGATGRVWYSGAPEATDYDEVDSGAVLVVELPDDLHAPPRVEPRQIGTWRFVREVHPLDSGDDIARLAADLQGRDAKDRTVLKLGFEGSLSLRDKARIDEVLESARDLYAGVQLWDRMTDLAVLPEDADFESLGLAGFAAEALEELRAAAERPGVDGVTARDALALLVRLAGSGER
ncbi:MAG: exonuclease SbcCD subunit D [Anaerolineae bacterium]